MAEEIDQPFIAHQIHAASDTHKPIVQTLKDLYERSRSSDRFWLGVILVAAALVILPLFTFGVPYGYDLGQHLRMAQTFREGLVAGDLAPSWGALDNYGFGSIAVRIYPPVFDYAWGFLAVFTGDYYVSILLTIAIFTIPGSIGIYYWVREYADHQRSGFAAVCYLIVPYHLMQVYQSGLFSEFAAAAVLPFCFLFATRIIRKRSSPDVIGLAVSYALLILTHIPSIIIGSLALSVYCLALLDWKKPFGTVFRFAVSFVLAAAASSFYWLRVVTEFNWVRVATEAENFSGHYNFRQYLFPMLFSSNEEIYWSRVMWVADIVIVLTFLLVVPAVIALFTVKMEPHLRRLLIALTATSVFLLFILSSASSIVWEYAPLLHRIQFAWRFLVAGSVISAVAFALSVPLLWKRFQCSRRVMSYAFLIFSGGFLIFSLGEIILPAVPLTGESFASKYRDLNESEGCNCFWPSWGNAKALQEKEAVRASERPVQIVSWECEDRRFSVSDGAKTDARVATFWYPYWSAEVNGSPVEVVPDANGAIVIPIPAEKADVRLSFKEPGFLQIATYLSLIMWVAFFAFLVSWVWRRRRDTSDDRQVRMSF